MKLYLTSSKVVSTTLIVSAPTSSEHDTLTTVGVGYLNTEVFRLVTLLPVSRPPGPSARVIMVVVFVAVQTRARCDGWSLTGVLVIITQIILTYTDGGVIVTVAMVTMFKADITPGSAVLNVEVIIPTTSVLIVILGTGHSHTKVLFISTHLINVKTRTCYI